MHKPKKNTLMWLSAILLVAIAAIGFYIFSLTKYESSFYWKISDEVNSYINEGGLIIEDTSYDVPAIRQEYTLYDRNSNEPVKLPKGTRLKSSLMNSESVVENDNTQVVRRFPVSFNKYEEVLEIYIPEGEAHRVVFDWQGLSALEAFERVESDDIEENQAMFISNQIDLSSVQVIYYTLPNGTITQVPVENDYIVFNTEDIQNGFTILIKANGIWYGTYVTGVEI